MSREREETENWTPTEEDAERCRKRKEQRKRMTNGNGSGSFERASCRGGERNPQNGGIMMTVELCRPIVEQLKQIGKEDGIKSVYQVIRNACHEYVRSREGLN